GLSIDEYKRKATAVAALQNSFKGLAVGVDRFKDSFGKTVSLLRNSTMRIAGLTTAALAFAGSVSKQGNALRLMSERTGIATETLQRLQFAARRAGMESGTLDQVLDKFSVSLGKAAGGSKQQADALARLGIDAKTVAAVPLNKMLAAVADGMKHLTSESERALTAQALFGESGKGMINLLSGGKEGLAALQAQATGKVAFFKSGDIVAAKQFEETFDDVKQTFVALRNAIGIKIFTQLRGSLNQISAWFSANQEKLVTGVSGLINAFAAWLPHIVAAAGAVAKAVVAPDMTYSF
ncbi:MAG: hypothetical protein LBS59_04480, partial [Puniceicoccales bacterium]|nr:hypothetical protein [Puniceicoccales bacterium]